jgi:hypothetical protein
MVEVSGSIPLGLPKSITYVAQKIYIGISFGYGSDIQVNLQKLTRLRSSEFAPTCAFIYLVISSLLALVDQVHRNVPRYDRRYCCLISSKGQGSFCWKCGGNFAHNNPSSSLQPSTTDRLREMLQLFDIRLLDHLIVGGGVVYSLSQFGLI